jgi:hypothetical protein
MQLAAVCALWIITAWRLPSASQEPWKRALWAALAFLALALTIQLPAASAWLDARARVTDLSALVAHLAIIAACAALLEWTTALTPAAHRPAAARIPLRRLLAGAAILVLALAFPAIPRREAADFGAAMAGNPAGTAWLLGFEACIAAAMTAAAGLFARAARLARPGLLAWGLRLLTAGTVLAGLYAAARSGALVAGLLAGGASIRRAVEDTAWLGYAALAAILAGITLPALTVGARTVSDYRALHALRPMWAQLTAAAPQVILGAPPSRRDDVLSAGAALRPRLARRTVEIRDAALLLRAHISDADASRARQILAGTGLSGGSLEAAAEAAWLRAAIAARQAGLPALVPPPARTLTGGTDITGEARWLRQVSAAWKDPAVAAAAAAISPPPQPAASDPAPGPPADPPGLSC